MPSPRGVPGSLPGTRALCFYARLVEAPLEAVANLPTFCLAGAVAPRRGLVRASALAQPVLCRRWEWRRVPPLPRDIQLPSCVPLAGGHPGAADLEPQLVFLVSFAQGDFVNRVG